VVDVLVTTPGGTSANTAADNYTYVAPAPAAPTVTLLNPTSGTTAGGTMVVITGTNLTGATAVTFGGTAATSFMVDSATQIMATSPAHAAGVVDVLVTTPGGTSANTAADNYTYVAPVAQTLFGHVDSGFQAPSALAGALVTVRRDSDSAILGTAITDVSGNFTINMTGVPLGTAVSVQASATLHKTVLVIGVFDEVNEEVSFIFFTAPSGSDRRLPFDDGTPPPLPFNGLWPD